MGGDEIKKEITSEELVSGQVTPAKKVVVVDNDNDKVTKELAKLSLAATIVTDEKFLRQVSKKTSSREVEKRMLVPLIKYAMHRAWTPGYGLAAVQVGIPIRAAWFWVPVDAPRGATTAMKHREVLLINPVITKQSEPIIVPGEGCLSIPNKLISIKRYNQIEFENDGQLFSAEGKEAQIIQHEIDHMDGILIIDKEYKSNNVGRNDPCPCGSGKKYKKCCISKI
jgi:peptide deformylase